MTGAGRYESVQPGIRTLHSFSAGAHYDPDNLSFGPVVGLDEHRVDPGAGFDWHGHRGVRIVSWVLEGTLRHEDSGGDVRLIGPGALLVQSTGAGIRHRETNPSDVDVLRFLQVTVLDDASAGSDEPGGVRVVTPPARVGDVLVDVLAGGHPRIDARGPAIVHGIDSGTGTRLPGGGPVEVEGPGDLLVLVLAPPP